jgi:VWFA-related protein
VTRRWGVLLAVLVVASASDPTGSQNPPQPTFRTEANYVRVDVYPSKDGAPVTDLRQEDFEVVENGAPQRIEQFEHVVIRAAGPQETRTEPNTVAESRSMAESSRARLLVVFLDTYHVDVSDSYRIRKPLIDALDRVIGQDDMVAVMTPEMSARDIVFARKTTTIDGFLTRYWHWGERNRMIPPDPEDEQYGICYPNETKPPPGSQGPDCTDQNGIAAEMIDRRHEKRALDALQDLVRYLRGVREERKAILAITNGWLLYRPNQSLMRPLNCHGVPTGPTVGIDPRTGKLTTAETRPGVAPRSSCDTDRMHLGQLDDWEEFRQMLDEANRANASFYPVDPRGLAAFDTPMMRTDVPGPPPAMVAPNVDRAMLAGRLTSLRTLAEATDGLAIVDSNDLAGGFRRVVADLSSYYLLGYYSTGKLDGRFHSISVHVKRPGVQVRARRGYLAATPEAVTAAAARAGAAAAPAVDAETLAIDAVLGPLNGFTRELPVRVQAAAGWKPDHAASVWVVGEVGSTEEWRSGVEADVQLVGATGATLASSHVTVAPGARTFRASLTPADPLAPGDYTVRVRARGAQSSMTSSEVTRFALPASPDAAGAVFVRRGPTTGNREVATADLRFRRSEQLRVEIPVPEGTIAARLLDRKGKALPIPVAAAVRQDADGSRWQTAQLALAPLAAGDYLIEMATEPGGAAPQKRVLVAFRVIQ